MSADNGVYILRTPKDDGYEYRVAHLQAVENYLWDENSNQETDDEDVHIENARRMWAGSPVFTEESRVFSLAFEIYAELDICEYGVSIIDIDREF